MLARRSVHDRVQGSRPGAARRPHAARRGSSSAFELLAPSLLAALVVTQAVGGDEEIVLDARLVGVGAGLVAICLRAPLIVVIVVAAAATALARLL